MYTEYSWYLTGTRKNTQGTQQTLKRVLRDVPLYAIRSSSRLFERRGRQRGITASYRISKVDLASRNRLLNAGIAVSYPGWRHSVFNANMGTEQAVFGKIYVGTPSEEAYSSIEILPSSPKCVDGDMRG